MRAAGIALLALLVSACVFRTADAPRYYRPEAAGLSASATDGEAVPTATVRLRAMRARPFLRERIVWRTPSEYGMYEQRRWSELPEAYAERALTAALLRTSRIAVTDDGGVPALSADVTAFDEVLAPAHVANVALTVSLTDPSGHRLLERTFSSEVPVTEGTAHALAHAIGAALDDVCDQVARSVATALRPLPHGRPRGKRPQPST